jgi:exodeoxyribonuclease III
MKIATWNVNGIRARQAQMLEWVEQERPDVICLQEIKAKLEQVPEALCNLSGYWCYWHGSGGYSGVGLHLRQESFPSQPIFDHPDFDRETRIVQARAGDIVFASVYVPNGGKDFEAKLTFMEAIDRYIVATHQAGLQLILCGDLNVAHTDADLHPKERKPNAIGQLPIEREIFDRWLSRGMSDVMRRLHPEDDSLFTWWAPWRNLRQRNIGWRIDYILASEPLAGRASRSWVQREVGTSDHGPLLAEFDVPLPAGPE